MEHEFEYIQDYAAKYGNTMVLEELNQWLDHDSIKEFIEDTLGDDYDNFTESYDDDLDDLACVMNHEHIFIELDNWLTGDRRREFIDDFVRMYDLEDEEE
jgi:hypothetical protein